MFARSIATLVTLVTVLDSEQFTFPCKVFLKLTLAADGLSMSRKLNWSFFRQNKDKSR